MGCKEEIKGHYVYVIGSIRSERKSVLLVGTVLSSVFNEIMLLDPLNACDSIAFQLVSFMKVSSLIIPRVETRSDNIL